MSFNELEMRDSTQDYNNMDVKTSIPTKTNEVSFKNFQPIKDQIFYTLIFCYHVLALKSLAATYGNQYNIFKIYLSFSIVFNFLLYFNRLKPENDYDIKNRNNNKILKINTITIIYKLGFIFWVVAILIKLKDDNTENKLIINMTTFQFIFDVFILAFCAFNNMYMSNLMTEIKPTISNQDLGEQEIRFFSSPDGTLSAQI